MFKKIKSLVTMCPECEVEREVQYGTKEETLNIRKENIDVISKVFYCPTGNHFFFDIEDNEERIQFAYREYRKRRNILQPEEIKEIRNKYGLTQQEFSLFLGYGAKTIARYETGAIPDDPHNYFIKLMQDTYSFLTHFHNSKDKLPIKLRQKIESKMSGFRNTQYKFIMPHAYPSGLNKITIDGLQMTVNTQCISSLLMKNIGAISSYEEDEEEVLTIDKNQVAANNELSLAA